MKQAKTPKIDRDTKILCFDIESNGLHGEAFAVGAVLVNSHGKIEEQFTGRCKIEGDVDAWVKVNVIPYIDDIEESYSDSRELREGFWKWYLRVEPKADYVLVSNGYPVEYKFLLKCQEENLEERYWQHPFPILDLMSLMIQAEPNSAKRNQIVKDVIERGKYSRHHPLHDAIVSAQAAFESFRILGRLK